VLQLGDLAETSSAPLPPAVFQTDLFLSLQLSAGFASGPCCAGASPSGGGGWWVPA